MTFKMTPSLTGHISLPPQLTRANLISYESENIKLYVISTNLKICLEPLQQLRFHEANLSLLAEWFSQNSSQGHSKLIHCDTVIFISHESYKPTYYSLLSDPYQSSFTKSPVYQDANVIETIFFGYLIPNSAAKAVLVLLLRPWLMIWVAYVTDQIDSKYFNINPQLENKEVRGRRLHKELRIFSSLTFT